MKCPHGCSQCEFGYQDCIGSPGTLPEEGDVGMCYVCGGWWTIIKGACIKYIPTPEESNLAYSHLSASRKRADEAARQERKRLL